MIAFEVPEDNVVWRYLAYRLHNCCPVMFAIDEAGRVWVDPEHRENARVRRNCEACREARMEHDWGDV